MPKYVKEEEDLMMLNKVQDYFVEIQSNKCMNDVDRKLFNLLTDDYCLKEDMDSSKSVLFLRNNK